MTHPSFGRAAQREPKHLDRLINDHEADMPWTEPQGRIFLKLTFVAGFDPTFVMCKIVTLRACLLAAGQRFRIWASLKIWA